MGAAKTERTAFSTIDGPMKEITVSVAHLLVNIEIIHRNLQQVGQYLALVARREGSIDVVSNAFFKMFACLLSTGLSCNT